MECIQYDKLGLSIFCETFSNGLELHMIPLKGMSQTFAVLNVNIGANDTAFINTTTKEKIEFPLGTAHFIEHLMFRNKNAIDQICSEIGATISAKTNYNNTEFLISCSGNIEAIIPKLFTALLNQSFSKFEIENEKRVIKEEILVYQDEPSWIVYRDLVMQMYPELSICTDVSGTIDSIKSLDKELLEQVHNIYYKSNNMKLVVVGDVNPIRLNECIFNTIERNGHHVKTKDHEVERFYPKAQNEPYKNIAIIKNKAQDLFSIGLRRQIQEDNKIDNYLATQVIMESLFGLGSTLTVNLKKEGLITNKWSYSNYTGPNYDFSVVSSSTMNLNSLVIKIWEELQQVRKNGLMPSEIDRATKKMIGQRLLQIDNIKEFTLAYSENLSNGFNYFDFLDYLHKVDCNYINSKLESIVSFDHFLNLPHEILHDS
ncbi:pitrilysin family protein [Lysinibacillus capsici]|uniref:EF-P 5-aminopentanol modification-associated protein YfmH n=1 Tax=Lysinibacillus TaxID=400634 RepID=UPI000824BB1A|nr:MULTISPECIES: pitrilysin family protein [Lysinibacillus]AUS84889.1 hypothetical protein LBYS11_00265 [Lysinibacillus sp. YS11]MEC1304554.1 pitrilysin family protein [Lysinibacillus capsici]MED3876121.1 pitrilysin family protein [Lysinibacillus capsici]OCX60889.1 hypothetical protein BFM98_20220 [Lysinibacillus sp. AR18-8]WPK05544.1 pitrilysin family protein [Lysinibacillus capsici]